jgi:hypothetical protein
VISRERGVASHTLTVVQSLLTEASRFQSGRNANLLCSRKARLMCEARLQGRTCQRRKARTTNSNHDEPIAPNLLLELPAPTRTDEVWVADADSRGCLFVAAVKHLRAKERIFGLHDRQCLSIEGPNQIWSLLNKFSFNSIK